VLVDGVSTTFTVEFSGTLPFTNKLSNVNGFDLRGEEIVVITTADGQRYFFLTNGTTSLATMDAFPNGAHTIENVDATTDILVCFVGGTLIRTPTGDVPVEQLRAGDLVLDAEGTPTVLRWISKRAVSLFEQLAEPDHRPIRIRKDAFGPGRPFADLCISPLHRILVDGWETELLFAEAEMFVAAKHLLNGSTITRPAVTAGVEYYHLLFDTHEVILANGLGSESLYPGEIAQAVIPDAELAALARSRLGRTARPVMSGREAIAWASLRWPAVAFAAPSEQKLAA